MSPVYACPLCSQALTRSESRYVCPGGHSFDIAREGYVNLLPVQAKRSLEPGDSQEMIRARRCFLERGHYAPLREAIVSLLARSGPIVALLDLGAGEGWYCGELPHRLNASVVHGIDISKVAIKMAARRYRDCRFAVASSYALPYTDGGFSHLLNVFAPLEPAEAARMLAPGGLLLQVSPAPQHLFALKSLLYQAARAHPEAGHRLAGFDLLENERLSCSFSLESIEALIELIGMTPYFHRLARVPRENLERALPLNIELDVWLSLYALGKGLSGS